ncbi:MAG: glycoside hydrolase family 43 protein [Eubacterium sp.]
MNYLFCYFTGNEPENESVHFALSKDGYNFTPLNNNKPCIIQTMGKKCMRDPFIFKGEDAYYIIATDMRSSDGWNSNSSMVCWKSEDLINWNDEHIIDMTRYEQTASADRVWAPEVYFDSQRGEYMIYWSNHNAEGDDKSTVIWYAYSKDLKTLSTNPSVLYRPANGLDAIDADIIFKDGKYYMYYKDEYNKTVCLVTSDCLTGPYSDIKKVACTPLHVEGNCSYPLYGTDKYIMIMDKYVDGGYFMQESENMTDFKEVKRFSLDFSPRHGSIILIDDNEYSRMLEKWG